MTPGILNLSFYRFQDLDEPVQHRLPLREFAEAAGLRGTVLLSTEGVNGFVAGPPEAARAFLQLVRDRLGMPDLDAKESWSEKIPFQKMLVKMKKEIIPMGAPELPVEENSDAPLHAEIRPRLKTAARLDPKELKAWLDSGKPVRLIDTRNEYEISLGTFVGAQSYGLRTFRKFPDELKRAQAEARIDDETPTVMFCTGGIRCEKAGAYALDLGLKNVYQLEGGILKYFELCGGAHYDGECFVFDRRVAVTPDLKPSQKFTLCYACRTPLTPEDLESPHYVYEKACPHCVSTAQVTG